MYKDIGRMIKTLAEIICWIGIIVCGILGIYTGRLIITIVGALASWLSTFVLYGFGELIDQNTQAREELEEIKMSLRSLAALVNQQTASPANKSAFDSDEEL